MLMNRYGAARQRAAKPPLVDLPLPFSDRYCIVLGHHPFGLHGENPLQVLPATAPKRRPFLFACDRKLGVELAYVALPQKLVGLFPIADFGPP
jgi:hypothetical protein